MTSEKKKTCISLFIAVFMVSFVFVCTGCMYEEIEDERGTIRSYHRPMLFPHSIRLRVGGRIDSTELNEADQK